MSSSSSSGSVVIVACVLGALAIVCIAIAVALFVRRRRTLAAEEDIDVGVVPSPAMFGNHAPKLMLEGVGLEWDDEMTQTLQLGCAVETLERDNPMYQESEAATHSDGASDVGSQDSDVARACLALAVIDELPDGDC